LRSVGRVRAEMFLLVLERTTFTVAGCAAIALGSGPLVPLALYGVTNSITAILATIAVRRNARGRVERPSPPLLDREGRHTALAASLVIIAPRVSIVVLLVRSSQVSVGSFAVAQKPTTDALALLAVAMLTPMLPLLRARVVAGRRAEAIDAGFRLTTTVLLVCAPVLAWLAVDARGAVRLLYGDESRPGATTALVVLCAATVATILRSFGELLLLAEERASSYVRALGAGAVTTLVVAVALVGEHGAAGAAWGSFAGEAVALVLVLRASRGLRAGMVARGLALPAVVFLGTAVLVVGAHQVSEVTALGVAALASCAVLVPARRALRAVDRRRADS
ncbi:MAG: hypothetical protein QOE63_2067, partial [Acidimicrobiaceae bacterium]